MLFLMLLQATNSSAAQPPARPKAIFSGDDYPAEARINHWEGTAIADLTIGPDGHVAACRIVHSTGHELLDDTTCDLITKRALFNQKTDSQGRPVAYRYRTPPINWSLPR